MHSAPILPTRAVFASAAIPAHPDQSFLFMFQMDSPELPHPSQMNTKIPHPSPVTSPKPSHPVMLSNRRLFVDAHPFREALTTRVVLEETDDAEGVPAGWRCTEWHGEGWFWADTPGKDSLSGRQISKRQRSSSPSPDPNSSRSECNNCDSETRPLCSDDNPSQSPLEPEEFDEFDWTMSDPMDDDHSDSEEDPDSPSRDPADTKPLDDSDDEAGPDWGEQARARKRFMFPPSLDEAQDALDHLRRLLKPPRPANDAGKKQGIKETKFDKTMQQRLEGMRLFLWNYIDMQKKAAPNKPQWMNTSFQMAKSLDAGNGKGERGGKYTAERLRTWTRAFLDNHTELPKHRYGAFGRSLIDDEDFKQELNEVLVAKGKYCSALDLVHYIAQPDVLARLKREKTISLATAC